MKAVVSGNALLMAVDKQRAGWSIGDWLRRDLRFPDGFCKQLFAEGRVVVGSQAVAVDHLLQTGQRVRLMGEVDEPSGIQPHKRDLEPLCVLYEDDHALVVHKPANLLVHPGTPADDDTLAHRVAAYFAEQGLARRVRHVHRLDKDTTGAVLYAKHAYAARTFDAMLAEHSILRTYLAAVAGRLQPPSGVIDAAIGRDRHVAGRYRVSPGGKSARTRYSTLKVVRRAGKSVSLVACVLETGRTHQIRVHMAYCGAPVVGDAVYGGGHGTAARFAHGHALHASMLAFVNPYIDGTVQVQAPVPHAFQVGMLELGFPPNWQRALPLSVDVAAELQRSADEWGTRG